MSFAAKQMNLKITIMNEVSQIQEVKYHMILLTCGILKKKGTNEFIYKTDIESQMQKTNIWFPWDKDSEG